MGRWSTQRCPSLWLVLWLERWCLGHCLTGITFFPTLGSAADPDRSHGYLFCYVCWFGRRFTILLVLFALLFGGIGTVLSQNIYVCKVFTFFYGSSGVIAGTACVLGRYHFHRGKWFCLHMIWLQDPVPSLINQSNFGVDSLSNMMDIVTSLLKIIIPDTVGSKSLSKSLSVMQQWNGLILQRLLFLQQYLSWDVLVHRLWFLVLSICYQTGGTCSWSSSVPLFFFFWDLTTGHQLTRW